ncbi:serine-rich adhesin for platelets-like isoform X1 [Patella vulgata]|uniref:serine-rich adhesin for platelets-like isoform X1 n=1 Tax=Patella vulgata TaxID=6465 RepID=UPI0024A94194|nr:serine-rich adhesin for platelets-like isoform X1 [Patella vulgata]
MVPQLELLSNSKTQDVSRQRKQQLGVYSAETNCLDQENLRNKSKFRKGTAPDLSSAGKTHTGTDDIRMMEKPELRRRSPVPEEKSCVTARKSLTKKPDHPESIGNSTNKTNIGSQKRSQKHLKPTTGETDTSDSSTEPKPTSTPKEKIRIKIKSLPNDKGITGDTTTSSNSLPTTPVKVKFKSAKPRGMVLSEENVSLSANSGSLNKSSASYSEHQSNYGAPGNEKVDENELSRSSSSVISENEPISESENGQAESSSGTTTKDSEIDSVSESDAQKSEEVGPLGIQEAANDSVIVLVPGEKRTQILGHTSHQPSKKSKSEKPYSKDNIEFNDISHTLAGLPTINTTMTGSPRAESFKSEEKYSDMEFQDVSGNSVVLKLNEEPPLYWNETQTSLIDNTNSSSNKDKTNTDPPKNANILSLGEYNFDNDDNLRKSDKSLHGDSSSNKDKTNTDPPKNANILSSGEYNFDNDDNLKKSDKSLHGEDTPLNTSLKNMTYVQKTSQDSSLTGTQSKDLYQGTSIPEVSDQSTKSLVPGNPLQKPQQPTNRFESETLSSPTDVNVLNEGDFQTTKVAALNPLKTGKTDIQNINTTVPLSWNQTQGQYVVDDNYEELISLPNKSDELSKLDSQISNNIECFKPDNQIQKQQPLTEENLSGSLHESDHFNRTGSNVQNISQDSPITGAQSKDLYQGTSIPEVSDQSTKSLVPGNKDLYQGTSIPEVSDQSTKSLVPGNPLQKPQQPTNRFESETLSSPTDVNILNEGDFQITKLAALNPLKTGRTDIQNINTTVPLSWNQTQGQYVVDDNYEKLISLPNKSDELSKLDNEIPNNIECFKPDNQIQKQQPLTEENLSGSLHESDHFNRTGSNVQKISQDSPITGAQSKDQYQGTSISEVSDQSANSLVPGNTLQKPQQPIESETLSSSSDVNALNEGDFQSSNTLPFMQAINSDRQLCPPIQSMLASEVAGQNFLKTGKTDIQNINTTVPLSWNQTQGHYIVDDNQEEIISSQNKSDKPSKLDSQIPNTTNSSKLDNQTQKQQTLRGENSSGSLNKSDHYNRSGSNIPETIQHTKQAEKLKVQTFCCEMSSIDKSGIEDVATTSDYHHIDTRGREIQQNESENSEDSRGVEEADTDYSDDSLNGAHLEGNQQPNIENETESINHTAGMENLNKPPIIATTSNTQYQNLLPEDSLMHQEPQSLVVKVDSVSSQLSNDSTADILQQNSKDQILSSNQSGSSRRQRKRAQRHQKDVKSDDTDEFSDDSLASGSNSKPSSRPGSGKRRKRTRNSTEGANRKGDASTDEYAHSGNSSFSDDSLTFSEDRRGSHTIDLPETNLSSAVEIAHINESLDQLNSALHKLPGSTDPMDDSMTQTEGGSIQMGMSPVSIWSSGDSGIQPLSGTEMSSCGIQTVISEENSIKSPKRRAWNLSISNPDVWKNNPLTPLTQTDEVIELTTNDSPIMVDYSSEGQSTNNEIKFPSLTTTSNSKLETVQPSAVEYDPDGKIKYLVTINEDETKILYNVEKTEYRTYSLGEENRERQGAQTIPDSIKINLTETKTVQKNDNYETVQREKILYQGENAANSDAIVSSRLYQEARSFQLEQESSNGIVSREHSIDRQSVDSDHKSFIKSNDKHSKESLQPVTVLHETTIKDMPTNELDPQNLSNDLKESDSHMGILEEYDDNSSLQSTTINKCAEGSSSTTDTTASTTSSSTSFAEEKSNASGNIMGNVAVDFIANGHRTLLLPVTSSYLQAEQETNLANNQDESNEEPDKNVQTSGLMTQHINKTDTTLQRNFDLCQLAIEIKSSPEESVFKRAHGIDNEQITAIDEEFYSSPSFEYESSSSKSIGEAGTNTAEGHSSENENKGKSKHFRQRDDETDETSSVNSSLSKELIFSEVTTQDRQEVTAVSINSDSEDQDETDFDDGYSSINTSGQRSGSMIYHPDIGQFLVASANAMAEDSWTITYPQESKHSNEQSNTTKTQKSAIHQDDRRDSDNNIITQPLNISPDAVTIQSGHEPPSKDANVHSVSYVEEHTNNTVVGLQQRKYHDQDVIASQTNEWNKDSFSNKTDVEKAQSKDLNVHSESFVEAHTDNTVEGYQKTNYHVEMTNSDQDKTDKYLITQQSSSSASGSGYYRENAEVEGANNLVTERKLQYKIALKFTDTNIDQSSERASVSMYHDQPDILSEGNAPNIDCNQIIDDDHTIQTNQLPSKKDSNLISKQAKIVYGNEQSVEEASFVNETMEEYMHTVNSTESQIPSDVHAHEYDTSHIHVEPVNADINVESTNDEPYMQISRSATNTDSQCSDVEVENSFMINRRSLIQSERKPSLVFDSTTDITQNQRKNSRTYLSSTAVTHPSLAVNTDVDEEETISGHSIKTTHYTFINPGKQTSSFVSSVDVEEGNKSKNETDIPDIGSTELHSPQEALKMTQTFLNSGSVLSKHKEMSSLIAQHNSSDLFSKLQTSHISKAFTNSYQKDELESNTNRPVSTATILIPGQDENHFSATQNVLAVGQAFLNMDEKNKMKTNQTDILLNEMEHGSQFSYTHKPVFENQKIIEFFPPVVNKVQEAEVKCVESTSSSIFAKDSILFELDPKNLQSGRNHHTESDQSGTELEDSGFHTLTTTDSSLSPDSEEHRSPRRTPSYRLPFNEESNSRNSTVTTIHEIKEEKINFTHPEEQSLNFRSDVYSEYSYKTKEKQLISNNQISTTVKSVTENDDTRLLYEDSQESHRETDAQSTQEYQSHQYVDSVSTTIQEKQHRQFSENTYSQSLRNSESNNLHSSDEIYLTPEEHNRSGSSSSSFKTPQESPRQNHYSHITVSNTEFRGPTYSESLPITSSKFRSSNDKDVSENVDNLKWELARRIAKLQSRVRSLSDSAISSDFTDQEASINLRNTFNRQSSRSSGRGSGLMNTQSVEQSLQEISTFFVNMPPHSSSLLYTGFCSDIPNKLANVVMGDHSLTSSPSTNNLASLLNTHSFSRLQGRKWRSFGELSELSGAEVLRLFKEDFEASQNRISLSHHDKNVPIPVTDLDADSDVEENLYQFTEEERYISWTDVQYSVTEDSSLDNVDSSSKREQINEQKIKVPLDESPENLDFYLGNIANIQDESSDVNHAKRRSLDRGVNCLPEDLFDESKRYLRQKSPSMSELENSEPVVKDFEKAHSTGCVDMLDSPVNSSASSNDSITFVFVGNSEEKTDRTHSNPNVSRPSSNTSSGRRGKSEGQLALICPNIKEKVLFPKRMQKADLSIGNRAVSTNNLSERLSEELRRSYSTSLLDVVTVEEPDIEPFPPSGNGEESIDGRTSEIVTVKSNNIQASQAVTKKQILRTFSSQFGPSCVSSTGQVHSETTGKVPKHTTCYIKSTGMETKRDDNVSISDIRQQTTFSNQKAPKVTLVNSATQIDDHPSENISSHICQEWQSYQDDIFSVDLSDESGFLTDLNSVPSSARDTPQSCQSSIRHFSGNTQEDMFTAFGSLRGTVTTLVSSYTQTEKESRDIGQGVNLNHSNSETQTTPPLSPELRRRHSSRTTEVQTERDNLNQNTQEGPSNTMILAEIVDLKKEHNKMMELLGRSRDRPSRLEILNSLKSPTSDSSGSISPITVIDKLSSSTRGLSPSHTTALSSNLIDDESQTEIRLNDSIDRLHTHGRSYALLDSSRNDNNSQRSFNSYSESHSTINSYSELASTRNQRDEIGCLDYSDTFEDQSGSSSSRSQGRNSNDSLVYVPIGTGNRRYFVTTAIEAADSLENLEDFSQTKVKYNAEKSQSGDKTADTGCLQDHLDMLQQERVEIIDLLNLNYLPASLTVELLEAKLNHCIGQTDALLQSLEDTWNDEEILSRPVPPVQKITEISKEYINKYRSELRQSKRDYTVFKEEMERKASKGRGRRKSRTSDLIRMTRKSQIDAFKLERMREQQLYERTRSASPLITPPASPARTPSTFEPSYLTPKQRIGHLVSLRKNIVESSEDEMSELRHGSYSPHYADRSYSPDYYATYSPSRRSSSLGYSQSHHSPQPPFSMYSPDVSLTLNLSNSPPPGLRTSSRDRSSVTNRSEHGNRSQDTSAYISLPYHQYMTEGLDPSRLLQESADVRNRNLLEISRAHSSLQQTKSHYTTSSPLRTASPSVKHSRSVREYSPVTPNHGISKDDIDKDIENLKHIQKTTAFGNSYSERSVSPSTSDISSISTPSYAAYAKDVLARSERSITNTTRSNKFPVSYTERDSSPSSIYSADLDSLPESTSTPRDNMRPINSQDIRTRIARRKMTEKKKRSTDRK